MEDTDLKELQKRRKAILYGKAEDTEEDSPLEDVQDAELRILAAKVDELEKKKKKLTSPAHDSLKIKMANEMRRAEGKVKEMEIAASLGVERVPHVEKVYYDSYPAYVKNRLPNPLYRLVRVFDTDGSILEEDAILLVHLTMNENFWPRDRIYVEPSWTHKGKWNLVGHYNHKGMRLE